MNRPHSNFVDGCHRRLIEERLSRKWSTFDVADKIGCSRSTYSQIEIGYRKGSELIWKDLESLFGVPREELKN